MFELASLAITDPTGRGDFHGDVDTVGGRTWKTRTADPRGAAGGQT